MVVVHVRYYNRKSAQWQNAKTGKSSKYETVNTTEKGTGEIIYKEGEINSLFLDNLQQKHR